MSALASRAPRVPLARAGGAGGPGGLLLLATQVAVLPFQIVGLGFSLIARTAQEVQRLGERAAGAGWSEARSAAPPPAAAAPSPAFPAPNASAAAAPAVGAAADAAPPKTREEKEMSDKNLSGTDLKIVEYSIVSVSPDIEDDNERILQGLRTVATSEDMNESDFSAWMIARFMDKHGDRLGHKDKQYIRVCYSVQCRLSMPEVNYQKKQADALTKISKTLKQRLPMLDDDHDGGDDNDRPAKER
jgi:hypothetical protein